MSGKKKGGLFFAHLFFVFWGASFSGSKEE